MCTRNIVYVRNKSLANTRRVHRVKTFCAKIRLRARRTKISRNIAKCARTVFRSKTGQVFEPWRKTAYDFGTFVFCLIFPAKIDQIISNFHTLLNNVGYRWRNKIQPRYRPFFTELLGLLHFRNLKLLQFRFIWLWSLTLR